MSLRRNAQEKRNTETSLLKHQLIATDEKLSSLRESRKAAAKAQRKMIKENRADRERKLRLIGEAVLRRIAAGEWNDAELMRMMDETLTRATDRALFKLDTDTEKPTI